MFVRSKKSQVQIHVVADHSLAHGWLFARMRLRNRDSLLIGYSKGPVTSAPSAKRSYASCVRSESPTTTPGWKASQQFRHHREPSSGKSPILRTQMNGRCGNLIKDDNQETVLGRSLSVSFKFRERAKSAEPEDFSDCLLVSRWPCGLQSGPVRTR